MCKKKLVNPPENHYKFWENEVMVKLGKKFEEYTYDELAELFGRTKGAVTTRVSILRICIRMSPFVDDIHGILKSRGKQVANTPAGKAQRSAAGKIGGMAKKGTKHSQAARDKMSASQKARRTKEKLVK